MIYKCKMCGGNLQIVDNEKVCTCEYCGTKQSVPSLEDKKIKLLFERGNELIRNCQFDDANEKYESILSIKKDDPEIYWNLLMCKFGISYELDPYTKKMIPTMHRTQDTSIFLEEDYRQTIRNSNEEQKEYYEKTAKIIDNIQKKYNDISSKEKPFDIFICYKQTDEDKNKDTEDYKIAYDLYNSLTKEGYKVFFSHVTLEDKIGEEYEPYIYAALKSAKVLLAVGTKQEYYNATWVKNEWSRFMHMMKTDNSKRIIPICLNTSILPNEFNKYQAIQIENNIVWKEDLIRNINKLNLKLSVIEDKVNNNNKEKENKKSFFKPVIIALIIGAIVFSIFGILSSNSEESKLITVPNISGLTEEEGIRILLENNLSYSIIYDDDNHTKYGEIILTHPSNNEEVEENSVIQIVVSNHIDYLSYDGDNNGSVLYKIRVRTKANNNKIREYPSTSSNNNQVGNVKTNEIYDVYELVENDNYLWYRIGKKMWVAENGEYFETISNEEYNQTVTVNSTSVGGYIYLGEYEQDNNVNNGKEPIMWRVLANDGNKMLLVSEYGLDTKIFNSKLSTWNDSSIREWLNGDFCNDSLPYGLRKKIVKTTNITELNNEQPTSDYVFLLSMTEVETYFVTDESRICYLTDYAVSQGAFKYDDSYACHWFTRTISGENKAIVNVRTRGNLRYVDTNPYDAGYAIRPAMWVKIG